jgi:hypothetical protein
MAKWQKHLMVGITAGLLALMSLPALAGSHCFDRVGWNHERRIHQGWHSGALTPREYARLQHREAQIRRAEARMMADGHLSRRERARLQQMLNHYNRDLHRYKHHDWRM